MKYENFPKAKVLVDKIDECQAILHQLNSSRTTVIINANEHNGRVMTIGAGAQYEHEYSLLAGEFIDKLKQVLLEKILKLEAELEQI